MTASELAAWRVTDRAAWNRFVDSAQFGAFPQLWEWGELRSAAGWRPIRLAVGDPDDRDRPLAGVQLLLRAIPVLGWHLAYAPRGPIGALDDPVVREALLSAMRRLARSERIATLKADPEIVPTEPAGAAFLGAPWRGAQRIQPPRTRIVELEPTEGELRSAMARKHRQYVNKAERSGIEIEHFDGESDLGTIGPALADFNRIYRLTADRAGFVARQPAYYERVWSIFAPAGRARLSFATLEGERVATLFHFTCGPRVVESYGGMTDAGAESRANYLLKWRAIAGFRAEGFAVYDMWGLATGGIEKFKAGFGGREVEYVGARDLPLQPAVDALLRVALPAHRLTQRARAGLSGRSPGGQAAAPLEAD